MINVYGVFSKTVRACFVAECAWVNTKNISQLNFEKLRGWSNMLSCCHTVHKSSRSFWWQQKIEKNVSEILIKLWHFVPYCTTRS